MRLEVGKKYRTRNGKIRGPLEITKRHPDRFTDEMGNWYAENGRYWQQDDWCPFSLVSEVTDDQR